MGLSNLRIKILQLCSLSQRIKLENYVLLTECIHTIFSVSRINSDYQQIGFYTKQCLFRASDTKKLILYFNIIILIT
jgi:hypothetical protein